MTIMDLIRRFQTTEEIAKPASLDDPFAQLNQVLEENFYKPDLQARLIAAQVNPDVTRSGGMAEDIVEAFDGWVLKDSGADVRPVAFALVYAKKGWPILPLHTADDKGCSCGKADCSSPGKHPRTKHGVKDATKDGDRIRLWWEKWPDANMGIATGKVSNVVVLDVDPGHGGQESLARLEQDHGLLPQTLEQKTGGGGRHLVFKRPGMAARSRVGVAPGLDIRANGGYIVVSPSLHASGERYIWVNGGNPLALMPQWLEDIVSHNGRNSEGLSPSVAGSISQGERNNTLASLAGAMRHRGMTQESILAALLQENERRCDPPLDDKEVETIAKSISRYDPTDEEAFSSYFRFFRTADPQDLSRSPFQKANWHA